MTWAKFTQENIRRSQKEREASEKIRAQIDDCIRSCANEMWSQFNNVNNAFTTRIQETNNAKNNLQSHLQRVSPHFNFEILVETCKLTNRNVKWYASNESSSPPFNAPHPNITHKYETSGMRACKHGSDGCFPTARYRQPTFSDTSILRIISFRHHQAVVHTWEFLASFSDRTPFLIPTCHGLGKRRWKMETSPAVIDIPSPYLYWMNKKIKWGKFIVHHKSDRNNAHVNSGTQCFQI